MQEEIIEKHKIAKVLVEETLQEDTFSRNNDLWLCLKVWRKQGIKIYIDYEHIKEMFAPETISRCRREIQNEEGRLLPTDENVLRMRRITEETLRQYYGNKPKDIQ